MNEIALYGGISVRKTDIYYGQQSIDQDDIDAVVSTLRSRLITCGPKVQELEAKLGEVVNANYVTVCSNGTAALHLACLAAGIKEGDEVIVSSITFAASANCVRYCGGTVVFADIDLKTYNIDIDKIEKLVSNKTKAIIAVDFTGQVVDIAKIRAICDKYGLVFIEDAAHSIGSKYGTSPVGGLADMTTFSFHPVKTLTSGEGGAVTTNNEKFSKRLKLFHSHGITRNHDEMIGTPEGHWYYEQIELGYNYRMTDFQAALLLSQLNKLDDFSERRRKIAKLYDDAFSKIPQLVLQEVASPAETTRHLYILQLDLNKLECDRKVFFDAMAAERVNCQVHYIPVYYFPYYRKLGYHKGLCPNAEYFYERVVSIPFYPGMTDCEVEDTIKAVTKIIDYFKIKQ